MKKGDVGGRKVFRIKDTNNTVVDLTSATAVYLRIRRNNETVERVCGIVDPKTSGIVSYKFVLGDLIVAGQYSYELRVLFENGDVFHTSTMSETVVDTL